METKIWLRIKFSQFNVRICISRFLLCGFLLSFLVWTANSEAIIRKINEEAFSIFALIENFNNWEKN